VLMLASRNRAPQITGTPAQPVGPSLQFVGFEAEPTGMLARDLGERLDRRPGLLAVVGRRLWPMARIDCVDLIGNRLEQWVRLRAEAGWRDRNVSSGRSTHGNVPPETSRTYLGLEFPVNPDRGKFLLHMGLAERETSPQK
jgi:hypothetical protein